MMDAIPLLSETSSATEALASKAALMLFMARPIPAHSARRLHMAGEIQKAGGKEYHKKSSGEIEYDQADQKRAAQLEYYHTDDG